MRLIAGLTCCIRAPCCVSRDENCSFARRHSLPLVREILAACPPGTSSLRLRFCCADMVQILVNPLFGKEVRVRAKQRDIVKDIIAIVNSKEKRGVEEEVMMGLMMHGIVYGGFQLVKSTSGDVCAGTATLKTLLPETSFYIVVRKRNDDHLSEGRYSPRPSLAHLQRSLAMGEVHGGCTCRRGCADSTAGDDPDTECTRGPEAIRRVFVLRF